ncbi:MAG: glutamate mutase L [Candidatus Cloacimonetes bacterium]|nr:glutamate mutase L [Candidatus Cloacimonadota bacterium]MCF7814376.1 glutamate mutase L [Candidatus Cloacimonadota bacterium]MCF7868999.1 glutamate mutase L [Candidatus Cloacimonadota bacterium]MCF7884393.1 glutamate mutase L [Candidatus Cloacimonadota bacterium]
MNKLHICESCGKVMKDAPDFADGKIGSKLCSSCTDEFGYQKRYSQVLKETREKLQEQMGISDSEAKLMARENVAKIPFWAQKNELLKSKKKLIITDVGSTTTKALFLQKSQSGDFLIRAIEHAGTTVEKPLEDVNIGVFQAIRKIEKKMEISLLAANATQANPRFNDDTLYISTSSAGGGLQILVIGLTMFDSASSGKRCAYGAGGVILDTFAIDDKRSSLEQMQAMGVLHPDIILMSGGIDGGAVASLLRMGEILQLSNPKPKFGEKDEIPLIFAGNKDAQMFVAGLFQKRFELYIVPNIRPTLTDENLEPAREKIHKLFMENVMEQAPGYRNLKKLVSDAIIPTPTGVIQALQLVSEKLDENVMAVDIGGATTDVFSNIMGEYFRTVSANYGMSYSISNVQKDAGRNKITRWLPAKIAENYARNYIANKMLYPTFIAKNSLQMAIEHAVAREAISMSKKQHMEMNFNTKQIGFLDKIKSSRTDLGKITETFYFEQALEAKKFHMHDINILIGSGGVLAKTENQNQAFVIIYDGFKPEGITEIWRDRHFISPHLGKLAAVDESLAAALLEDECFDKVGLALRPLGKKWKQGQAVMKLKIADKKYDVKVGDVIFLENEKRLEKTVEVVMNKGFYLKPDRQEFKFKSDLPIFIDAALELDFDKENNVLQLYDFAEAPGLIADDFLSFTQQKKIETGKLKHKVELPYAGSINVKIGDKVQTETVIGENLFDPPRVYVITLYDKSYLNLNPDNLEKSLRIKEGEEVKYGQRIAEIGNRTLLDEFRFQHYYFDSPVRGRVEKINIDSGTIIMREIQDYSYKPKKIKVAKKLNVKPHNIVGYMKKSLNDFVYAGDIIASKIIDVGETRHPMLVSAPNTGTIKEINKETGTVIVQYDKEPYQRQAGISGEVISIQDKHSATIEFEGSCLNGIIGFGSEAWGKIKFLEKQAEISKAADSDIVVFAGKIDLAFLQKAVDKKVSGVVAASIDKADLVKFIGDEIGVALTGNEAIPFPLILTEGFGEFSMFQDYAEFLQQNNGKSVYINGHTQIRAGVVRPKIIIS